MAMNNNAYAYKQNEAYEQQSGIRVLESRQVKTQEDVRRAGLIKSAVSVMAVFVLLLAVTFASAKVYGLGVELNSIKAEIEDVKTATARVEMELGEMASLERIEEYALANLDMVYPGAEDFYYVTVEAPVVADAVSSAAQKGNAVEESGWDKFINGITGFFRGSASAATY